MKKIIFNKYIIFIFILVFNFGAFSFPVPAEGEAKFEIIRKKKVIGTHEIYFMKKEDQIILETKINIDVKVLFFPAYKFFHESKEVWKDNNFIKIQGYTDFEDEREYYIKGEDKENVFEASGMDGKLKLNIEILPSNFWNINILDQEVLFDTQKGIERAIKVNFLGEEKIEIDNRKFITKKYTLNASSNPKDKGPFPEYTIWYNADNNELLKFKFKNWKDKKIITIVRILQEK